MFSADLGGVIEVTTITGQIAYTTPGAYSWICPP